MTNSDGTKVSDGGSLRDGWTVTRTSRYNESVIVSGRIKGRTSKRKGLEMRSRSVSIFEHSKGSASRPQNGQTYLARTGKDRG